MKIQSSMLTKLLAVEVTDEDRARAIADTKSVLIKMNIRAVDELRKGLELPVEALGFVAEIYADILAAGAGPRVMGREVLPMSSSVGAAHDKVFNHRVYRHNGDQRVQVTDQGGSFKVKTKERISIVAKTIRAFAPERVFISMAGTDNGAADWIVNDIKIEGRSVFMQSGDIPGDMFAASAIESFVKWPTAPVGTDVELDVTYIGHNEDGCAFYGSMVGPASEPIMIPVAKEED